MSNTKFNNQISFYVIGVMSGTSLDGIDLCYAHFAFEGSWRFQIISSKTVDYSKHWQDRLRTAIDLNPLDLQNLNTDYTHLLSKEITAFIHTKQVGKLDAVCSHGHTVFHQPDKGITLQIGNLPVLATSLNQTVVCDFRTQDVALGGQGAPLVPIGDALLFSDYDFCLNLGGFANISFEQHANRIAFDICPVNIILNHYVKSLGIPYDDGGKIASSGALCLPLLEALNQLEFYKLQPPKSLGLEWVNSEIFPMIESYNLEVPTVLRTVVEHSALQISKVLNSYHLENGLITGGGVFNSFLMQRISELSGLDFPQADPSIIDYKEALVFGFLGVLRLKNQPNCLQSVTGASNDHSSGYIYFPEK